MKRIEFLMKSRSRFDKKRKIMVKCVFIGYFLRGR